LLSAACPRSPWPAAARARPRARVGVGTRIVGRLPEVRPALVNGVHAGGPAGRVEHLGPNRLHRADADRHRAARRPGGEGHLRDGVAQQAHHHVVDRGHVGPEGIHRRPQELQPRRADQGQRSLLRHGIVQEHRDKPFTPSGIFGTINARNPAGDEVGRISLIGDFPTCDSSEPHSLAVGARYTACEVYIAPAGQSVASVVYDHFVDTTSTPVETEITWRVA
jgi:hypothetical protein